jgi:fatty acid desaturase
VIPIKIGSFELKPFVFQIANQIMPRNEPDEQLQQQDDNRLANASPPSTGQKRLDYLYTNMAKFRHDMRFMTVSWGLLLIATFIVKVILVETQANISNAQTYGYYMFGIATAVIFVFTWIYTNIVEGHVLSQIAFWKEQQEEQQQMDRETETAANLNWGVNSMSNVFSQVVGGA